MVTATRSERNSFELPVSIDRIDADAIREGKPMINLSESLSRVPGVVVQNRQNYSQDLQISSRGFGAHAQFGVRGVRLYADGIPATSPDGQGQTSNFDLGAAERIEVMRGPFSTLYGNASGGVIQIFTEDGPREPTLTQSGAAGSYGTSRSALKFGGESGALNYIGSASHLETTGYRDHSAAENNDEYGRAWTVAGFWSPRERYRFGVEWLALHADRPAAAEAGFDSDTDAKQWKVEARIGFE